MQRILHTATRRRYFSRSMAAPSSFLWLVIEVFLLVLLLPVSVRAVRIPPSPNLRPSPSPGQSPSRILSSLPGQSPSPSVLPTIISDIVVRNAAVAADDGRCSIVGKDVLEENGNAVDAAVATALCLGVVSAASSGIGGGAFMVIRLANGTTTALDMRERAPQKTTPDMYNADPEAKVSGPLSIAIPGELKGYYKAWNEYGSGNVTWSRLFQPAIDFARNGFTISEYLHGEMLLQNSCIFNDTGLRSVYTKGNQLLKAHDMCKNEKLADTLSTIAEKGPSVLYGGEIGSNLVQDIQNAKGILTMDDLNNYEVIVRQPLNVSVFGPDSGLEVLTMPPPSSGGASFIMLFPNKVFYENITIVTQVHIEVSKNLLDYLEGKVYVLEKWDGEGAICQFVVTVNSTNNQVTNVTVLNVVSDPRKGGSPAGY